MAKAPLVSIGIGAAMQAGAGAVFGRTRTYLAGLGRAIEANARQAGRIETYRALKARLGKTRTTAREATERGSSPLAQGTRRHPGREGRLAVVDVLSTGAIWPEQTPTRLPSVPQAAP